MDRSNEIDKVSAAIVAAQSRLENLVKTENNPFYKSKYVPLDEALNVVRPVLAEHKLAIVQFPIGGTTTVLAAEVPPGGPGGDVAISEIGVETVIIHESGQFVSQRFLLPITKIDPQGGGAAVSYARRYALLSVLNLGAEDDDGNSVSKTPPQRSQGRPAQAPRFGPRNEATPQTPPRNEAPRNQPDPNYHDPAEDPEWIDEKVGGNGVHRLKTWRVMSEGSIDGARHQWARFVCDKAIEDHKAGNKPSPALAKFTARAAWVKARIESAIPMPEGHPF